jgi:hypothetical protein
MKEGKKSVKGAVEAAIRAVRARVAKPDAAEARPEPPRTERLVAASPSAPACPPKASAPARTPTAPEAATQAILTELASLRRMIESLSAPAPGPPKASASGDASLESGVDSMRRLLTELLESRLDPLIAELAAIRTLAASETAGNLGSVVDRLDLLLNDLGAVRFEAQRLDYYDPLIHQVLAERQEAAVPDRVVLETVVPGYRTQRGKVVAKAGVAINRRV